MHNNCKDCIHQLVCTNSKSDIFVQGTCDFYDSQKMYIKLPVAIGEPVYMLSNKRDCHSTSCMYSDCEDCPQLQNTICVIKVSFDLSMLKNWGHTIFATKADAENKLQSIKNNIKSEKELNPTFNNQYKNNLQKIMDLELEMFTNRR